MDGNNLPMPRLVRSSWSATTFLSRISERLRQGIDKVLATLFWSKVNQIGSLTETLEAMRLASVAPNYSAIISHRSGETEDAFIADLAVATTRVKSKPGRPAERIGSPNTINFCASKKNSGMKRCT